MRFKCTVVPEVRLWNMQQYNSLDVGEHKGERHREHVDRLRPEYERRIRRVHVRRGCYVVGANGEEIIDA